MTNVAIAIRERPAMKQAAILLCLVLPIVARAQAPEQSAPTIAETKAWIETEGAQIMSHTEVSRLGVLKSYVKDLQLENCTLSWKTGSDSTLPKLPSAKPSSSMEARVPLKDVDVGGFLVDSTTFMGSDPVFSLRIKTRAAAGATIMGWSRGQPQLVTEITAPVQNKEDGERLSKAISHAAVLCGAPTSVF